MERSAQGWATGFSRMPTKTSGYPTRHDPPILWTLPMLSEHRDLAAARAFFRSAKAVTGVSPDRVTTDGHDAYPRAIRTELGKYVRHRTSRYLNNRLEQDHRGIKDRCRPMLGLKSTVSATRYCRGYDELRNFLRCRSRMRQHVPAPVRRWQHMRKTAIVMNILATA